MNTPSLPVTGCFATPIVSTLLENSTGLNQRLAKLFLDREAEGERWRKRVRTPTQQVNIFESEFDLFNWPDASVQELRAFCLATLGKLVMQLNQYSPEQRAAMSRVRLAVDSWFHVTRSGGYIGNHCHPMASWSGVYCVKPGAKGPAFKDSGVLQFLDPRGSFNMYVDPGNVRITAPYAAGAISYPLEAGQLLLFPSYLPHEVKPFLGNDERITVAFNCSFTMPPGEVFGF